MILFLSQSVAGNHSHRSRSIGKNLVGRPKRFRSSGGSQGRRPLRRCSREFLSMPYLFLGVGDSFPKGEILSGYLNKWFNRRKLGGFVELARASASPKRVGLQLTDLLDQKHAHRPSPISNKE